MKSDERHELKQNDLVGSMAGLYVFLRKYGVYILLVVALGILAWELLNMHRAAQQAKLQAAWMALQNAVSPHQVQTQVLNKYKMPAVDARAYVKIGGIYLQTVNKANLNTIKGFHPTKAQAIAGAKLAFRKVIHTWPNEQLAVARSQLGLALAYEDAGQWTRAAAIYKIFTRKNATAMQQSFATLASYRLAHLKAWQTPVLVGPAIDLSIPKTAPATAPASLHSSVPTKLPASQPASGPKPAATTPAGSK